MRKEVQYIRQVPTHHPVYGTEPEILHCTADGVTYVWNRETKAWDSLAKITEAPYKTYLALVDQAETDAPTHIVFENTLGNLSWAYVSNGNYRLTSDASPFTDNDLIVIFPLSKDGAGAATGYRIARESDSSLTLFAPDDDETTRLFVHVRVYSEWLENTNP